jgi:hypothetical protein
MQGHTKKTRMAVRHKLIETNISELYYFYTGPDLRGSDRDGRPGGLHKTQIELMHFIETSAFIKSREVFLYF